ncbi:MAG: M67 family metallopeptidase [Anaerolineales bacterium]|jgi:proteasome lid subunit RPN8/RPN11
MKIKLSEHALADLHAHVESAYPEEGAGFLLGHEQEGMRFVEGVLPQSNEFDADHRRRRYLIEPQDMLRAENYADQHGYEILGIFHSHPDHPARPSDYDLEWSLPWFSYLITSVTDGKVAQSRCWRLNDTRTDFIEESIEITELSRISRS